jgi:hypothetical protein
MASVRPTNLGSATHAASNGQREENRCHGALPTMERSARIAGAAHVLRTYVIERGGARRTVPVGPVLVRLHLDRRHVRRSRDWPARFQGSDRPRPPRSARRSGRGPDQDPSRAQRATDPAKGSAQHFSTMRCHLSRRKAKPRPAIMRTPPNQTKRGWRPRENNVTVVSTYGHRR